MENLLITGGSGFIGSNFVHYVLQETDFQGRVINFDCLSYAGNPHNNEQIVQAFPNRYVFVQGDICNPEDVNEALDTYNVDSICHFAAESHVDRSIASPNQFLETNVFGTFTLLEAVRTRGSSIKRFHHVSTDEVYGSLTDEGYFTEETPYHPNNPYSASKAASDHLVQAYANTYRLPVTISNCSNNYGPFQFPEKLIPLVIMNAIEGRQIPLYGKGKNIRDWLYVRDHCDAIWTILTKGQEGENYNIGGNNELSNLQVVEIICDTLQHSLCPIDKRRFHDLITFVQDRPGHDWRYAIDASKIESKLHWQPKESFETGIIKTVDWYLGHLAWIENVRSGAYKEWIVQNYENRDHVRPVVR